MFLLDTNVICELRKGELANANVRAWFLHHAADVHFLSVLTVGEIRRGIEQIVASGAVQAFLFERSLTEILKVFEGRILDVGFAEVEIWGRLCPDARLPDIEGLLAATSIGRGLIVATRNTKDFARSGVAVVNPWEFSEV